MKNKLYYLSLLAFVLLVVFGVGILLANAKYPIKYEYEVEKYSAQFGVETSLIYAVIKQESNFNVMAVSSAGAVGLMQILPSTAKWYAEKIGEEYAYEKLFNADFNIKLGTAYIAYLQNKFQDETLVLCAYNAGEATVSGWIQNVSFDESVIPYKETRIYVSNVKKFKQKYENLLG